MATDFNSLWRREVEKLNRQIHKYEKEGVRFRVKAIEETEPKKKYTQADLDLVKAKRLTLFDGAEMFDQETWKTYRGKDEITNRIRQRKSQQEDRKKGYTVHQTKQSVQPIKTETTAELSDSIAYTLLDIAQSFDSRDVFFNQHITFHVEKDMMKSSFVSVISSLINDKNFIVNMEKHIDLVEELKAVLYASNEFFDSPRTTALIDMIYEVGQSSSTITNEELNAFKNKYGINETDFDDDFMF